jgi:hypothetical protein
MYGAFGRNNPHKMKTDTILIPVKWGWSDKYFINLKGIHARVKFQSKKAKVISPEYIIRMQSKVQASTANTDALESRCRVRFI